jgi:hypothetical protein
MICASLRMSAGLGKNRQLVVMIKALTVTNVSEL